MKVSLTFGVGMAATVAWLLQVTLGSFQLPV